MTGHRIQISAAVIACFLVAAFHSAYAGRGKELIEEREGRQIRPEIVAPTDELIGRLKLPPGFEINIFAEGLGKPRMLAVDKDGIVYVTRRDRGDVLALHDANGDGKAEETRTVVKNLPGVHGIAIHGDQMYLATVHEVLELDIRHGSGSELREIMSGLPPGGRHPNRTLGFGPDGYLYVSVGSTCNCCVEEYPESATILRAKPNGGRRDVFATGLRNTLGFSWHPASQKMYGMDNGTDWLGDNFPPEELNRLVQGKHYGWPFLYDQQRMIDTIKYPKNFDRQAYLARSTPSVLDYEAHSAPLQMTFYTASEFPEEYQNDAFVAMHGSWNRKPPSGYEVVRIKFNRDGDPVGFERFVTGFLIDDDPKAFGRPTGIATAADGSLLFSCDHTGVIYRVRYTGK